MQIRNAHADDAKAIAAIYNPYILTTTISFEEEPVSDAAMAQRNRLIAEGRQDQSWLAGLEDAMARHAVAATAARMALVARMNAVPSFPGFPEARMTLICPIADRLEGAPALAAEDFRESALYDAGYDRRFRPSGGAKS